MRWHLAMCVAVLSGCSLIALERIPDEAAADGGAPPMGGTSAGGDGGSTVAAGGMQGEAGSSAGGAGAATGAGAPGGGGGVAAGGAGGVGDPDMCPGLSMPVSMAVPVMFSGDTSGASNQFTSSSCSGYGAGSGELVYAVTPNASGTLAVNYSCSYNGHVYVRSTCTVEASELGCNGSDVAEIQVPATAGQPVYVIMDGGNSQEGTFNVTLTLTP